MKNFVHPISNRSVRLGKKAPRQDPRNLEFATYIKKLPLPPAKASFMQLVPDWPMYMNDELGDCVIAASAHQIQQWTRYAKDPVTISNADVLKGYEDVGGYVPGDPSTDNGCEMLTALNYWRHTGFGGHKIEAFMQINTSNLVEVRQAISLFGNVYLGIQLPFTAQGQVGPDRGPDHVWAVPKYGPIWDGSPGSWGGHAIPLMSYNEAIVRCVTWGAAQQMTWNFLKAYGDEAYAVLTVDWIGKYGKSPSGFDIQKLYEDLGQL